MLLGDILIQQGFCSPMDVLAAFDMQMQGDNRSIGEILMSMGKITQEELEKAIQIQKGSSSTSFKVWSVK